MHTILPPLKYRKNILFRLLMFIYSKNSNPLARKKRSGNMSLLRALYCRILMNSMVGGKTGYFYFRHFFIPEKLKLPGYFKRRGKTIRGMQSVMISRAETFFRLLMLRFLSKA